MNQTSELRQDLVTGEWVVVATGRAKRPNDFASRSEARVSQSKESCPFEELKDNAFLAYDRSGERTSPSQKNGSGQTDDWWVQVIPNLYPAFDQHGVCAVEYSVGPYRWQDGVGFHEIVVTRDHERSIAGMSPDEVAWILKAYRERYQVLKNDGCVAYISIFHNHGALAGASITHPHSQIIAIPVIPPDVGRSLRGSAEYYEKRHACVHCTMLEFELKDKKRVLFENGDFVALVPYVSRSAFEVRLFPKRHAPEFETTNDKDIREAAEALQFSVAKLTAVLGDPDYNFFVHTAPVARGETLHHYHWHIEIIPKTAVWAGFEIGTGIEISTIAPEEAAEALRGAS